MRERGNVEFEQFGVSLHFGSVRRGGRTRGEDQTESKRGRVVRVLMRLCVCVRSMGRMMVMVEEVVLGGTIGLAG